MNDKLKNKAVLVTGGASGIGAALCLTFARAGAMVWVADIDEAGGQAVAREIGGRFVALDVASESACTDAARTVGQLDVLANVAGIAHVGTLLNTSAEDCDRLHGVNVRGVFNCCKALERHHSTSKGPHLKTQGNPCNLAFCLKASLRTSISCLMKTFNLNAKSVSVTWRTGVILPAIKAGI